MVCLLNHWQRKIVSAIVFTHLYKPNWFNKYLEYFLLQIYVLDNKHANNNYWLISIQLLLFLFNTRFHSSPVKHKNFRLKVEFIVQCSLKELAMELNVQQVKSNVDLEEPGDTDVRQVCKKYSYSKLKRHILVTSNMFHWHVFCKCWESESVPMKLEACLVSYFSKKIDKINMIWACKKN